MILHVFCSYYLMTALYVFSSHLLVRFISFVLGSGLLYVPICIEISVFAAKLAIMRKLFVAT
ncbi:hypothetical protein BDW62DRAFT_192036 [Aspergillus aurantiobrunneus]